MALTTGTGAISRGPLGRHPSDGRGPAHGSTAAHARPAPRRGRFPGLPVRAPGHWTKTFEKPVNGSAIYSVPQGGVARGATRKATLKGNKNRCGYSHGRCPPLTSGARSCGQLEFHELSAERRLPTVIERSRTSSFTAGVTQSSLTTGVQGNLPPIIPHAISHYK
jgi:hypothetical protein